MVLTEMTVAVARARMRRAEAGGYEGSENGGRSESWRRQRRWDSGLRWELRETAAAWLGEGEI